SNDRCTRLVRAYSATRNRPPEWHAVRRSNGHAHPHDYREFASLREVSYGTIVIVPLLLVRECALITTVQVPGIKLFATLNTTCVNSVSRSARTSSAGTSKV